jgi:hypothetical protein
LHDSEKWGLARFLPLEKVPDKWHWELPDKHPVPFSALKSALKQLGIAWDAFFKA